MLDKKNPYTSFGQMLVSVGILNLIARANIIIDVIISFIFIAKGGTLIRDKKWPNDTKWNTGLSFTGIIYPIIKLVYIYSFIADNVIQNSEKVITKADVLFSSSVFLIPVALISFFALRKLKTINKDSIAE